ncbi:MAG: holo-ACP synthase [Kangiellaceae bacterium]|jgi:holo-[acyl-carrier protein] synthase|nr:holo-ACP synthase [Kangiellaceae bacterium]|tara:strand:+ start:4374 stop:4757 length:384 start_codon:yes stop_codon:yes gene_type:complete
MAIWGLGTDIVEIKRIEHQTFNTREQFADKILTERELLEYPDDDEMQCRFLSMRYAAKEAAAKALGTGISGNVKFCDFEVNHDSLGKPSLKLYGEALKIAKKYRVKKYFISLTDENHYASATVIFEK